MLPLRSKFAVATSAALSLVLSSCDMANVLSEPKQRKVAIGFQNDSTLVISTSLKPNVDVTLDGSAILGPQVRLESSDTTVIAISANGDSLIARKLGRAIITAVLEGTLLPSPSPSAVDTIYVVPKEFLLDRATVTFTALGDTVRLVATATDALNRAIPNLGVVWTSSDTTKATVTPTGLVTAKANTGSPVIISAHMEGITAVTEVSVAQEIARFAFIPSTITMDAIGAQASVSVSGRDRNNNPIPVLPSIAWTSGNAAIVSVHPANGTLVSLNTGRTYIRATSVGGLVTVTDTVHVEVSQQATRVSIIALFGSTIAAVGAKLQLDGRAYDRLNAEVKKPISWSTLDPDIAGVNDTGVVTARSTGTARIVARVDTASVTHAITITNDAVRIEVNPAAVTLTSVNDSVVLTVTGFNALGVPINNAEVTWRSTDSTVAKVLAPGIIRAERTGTANIIVTSGALTAQSIITVTNAPASIQIAPNVVSLLSIGDSISPAATLLNGRGDALPRTAATWTTDDLTIARVTANGMIVARDTGTTVVRATSGSVSDAVTVVVTNAAAFIILPVTSDTLTAPGQQVQYSAVVVNAANKPITGARVVWSSTNSGVAVASGTTAEGNVTATGYGTALIIATAGSVADTFQLRVVNPTRLYVDNGVFVASRVGTSSRPYARIQDAVNAADAFDTVFVRKGGSVYSETVALSKRIVLLGDSTGFNKSAPNPVVLPVISHDTGSAGITAITTSPQTIRFFHVRHTTDGPALYSRGAEIRVSHFYVNEGELTRVGTGVVIDNYSTGAHASVTQARISSVRGYGISFSGVTNGVIRGVSVTGVDSTPGTTGSGIYAAHGSGLVIDSATIRLTGGAQIHLHYPSNVTLSNSSLAGRNQLARLLGASGTSQILNNSFNLQLQASEPFNNGSAQDGRAGLTIDASQNVLVRDNVFTDGSAVMDAIRIMGSRGAGQYAGALFQRNQFTGGRYHVRSAWSTWSSVGSRSINAVQAVIGENVDTVSMRLDTVSTAALGCVDIQGEASRVTVYGATFSTCASGSATTMHAAVRSRRTISSISIDSSNISGANTIAVEHDGGGSLSFTRNIVFANGTRTLPRTGIRSVIAASSALALTVTGNRVRGYTDLAAAQVPSGPLATVSSNHFSRNRVGLRVVAGAVVSATDNDWFDNDSAAIAYAGASATMANNFWGDARGPKRLADPMATGDSALGSPPPAAFKATPTFPGAGAAEMRAIRGQTVTTPTRPAATVRVVDGNGLPVAGVSVTFTCDVNCGGGQSKVEFAPSPTFSTAPISGASATVVTNAAGLAEVLVNQMSPTATRTSTLKVVTSGLETAIVVTTIAP